MHLPIRVAFPLVVLTVVGSGASAQDVQQLQSACLAHNAQACSTLINIASVQCVNGNSDACTYALRLRQIMNPSFTTDPLGPQRGAIRSTSDYIKNHCNDPSLASQLKAFGYCR